MFAKDIAFKAVIVSLAAFMWSCSSNPWINTAQNADKIYGYLYKQDGTAAVGAQVTLVNTNYVPQKGLSKTAAATSVGVTDVNGRFTLTDFPSGTYNIFSESENTASFTPSVTIAATDKIQCIAKDTLKPTGSIQGTIRLSPQGDSRTVLVLVLGSTMLGWPDDSAKATCVFGDPEFVDFNKGNYRLKPGSPCIGTGTGGLDMGLVF